MMTITKPTKELCERIERRKEQTGERTLAIMIFQEIKM
jgi:hypothetical protein